MVIAVKSAFTLPALPNLSASKTAHPVLSDNNHTVVTTPPAEQITRRTLSRPPSPDNNKAMSIAMGFRRSISGRGHARATSDADHAHGGAPEKPVRSLSVAPLLGRLAHTASFQSNSSTPATTSAAHSKVVSPAATPALVSAPGSGATTPLLPQTLEASYVSKASLRLSELVNRIFAAHGPGPTIASTANGGAVNAVTGTDVVYNGRVAPRKLLAKEMGTVIAEQLLSSVGDPYLLRTILRSSILRAISVFHSRLEQALVAPLGVPDAIYTPRSVKEADSPPLIQRYNLEILKCVWEVRRGLDRACHSFDPATGQEGSEMPHFVIDALRPWREKLTIVIKRIIHPILDESKRVVAIKVKEAVRIGMECSAAIAQSIQHGVPAPKTLGTTKVIAGTGTPSLPNAAVVTVTAAPATSQGYKDVASILDGLRRLMDRLDCGNDSLRWVAALSTMLMWKGMLAYSIRRAAASDGTEQPANGTDPARARTPSPPHGRSATFPLPGATPSRSKSLFRRDPSNGKRSPSPPRNGSGLAAAAQARVDTRLVEEVEAFEAMVRKFVGPLSAEVTVAPSSAAPAQFNCPIGAKCDLCLTGRAAGLREDDDDDDTEPEDDISLAKEATVEALQAISAMAVVLRACNRPNLIADTLAHDLPLTPLAAFSNGAAPNGTAHGAVDPGVLKCPTLSRAITTVPTVILLHLIAVRTAGMPLPHEAMDMDWVTYEASLRGFAAAEEMSDDVAFELARRASSAPPSLWKTVMELALKVKAGVSVAKNDDQR